MPLLFLLNQKYLEIAEAESKAVALGWNWWENKTKSEDGALVLESRATIKQLGLAKRVVKILASCSRGNIRSTLTSIDWKVLKSKRYKVILTKQSPGQETERELASGIWKTLENPIIDLENPEIIVDIILTQRNAHVGLRLWENGEDFESRRAHLRQEMHPSSAHPTLCRALANLACTASLHDPCCGSGGIVIEAGIAGLRCSGADIDAEMIRMAKTNCAAYGLHPELRVADALQWMPRTGAIVADLPYGRNTTPVNLTPFLEALLMRAAQSTSRAIIGLHLAMPMPKGWNVRSHLIYYVHKSMTKHFYVLEKKS